MALQGGSSGKLLAVAALSASASAAATYALLRLRADAARRQVDTAQSDHTACCGAAPAKADPYDPSPRTGCARCGRGGSAASGGPAQLVCQVTGLLCSL